MSNSNTLIPKNQDMQQQHQEGHEKLATRDNPSPDNTETVVSEHDGGAIDSSDLTNALPNDLVEPSFVETHSNDPGVSNSPMSIGTDDSSYPSEEKEGLQAFLQKSMSTVPEEMKALVQTERIANILNIPQSVVLNHPEKAKIAVLKKILGSKRLMNLYKTDEEFLQNYLAPLYDESNPENAALEENSWEPLTIVKNGVDTAQKRTVADKFHKDSARPIPSYHGPLSVSKLNEGQRAINAYDEAIYGPNAKYSAKQLLSGEYYNIYLEHVLYINPKRRTPADIMSEPPPYIAAHVISQEVKEWARRDDVTNEECEAMYERIKQNFRHQKLISNYAGGESTWDAIMQSAGEGVDKIKGKSSLTDLENKLKSFYSLLDDKEKIGKSNSDEEAAKIINEKTSKNLHPSSSRQGSTTRKGFYASNVKTKKEALKRIEEKEKELLEDLRKATDLAAYYNGKSDLAAARSKLYGNGRAPGLNIASTVPGAIVADLPEDAITTAVGFVPTVGTGLSVALSAQFAYDAKLREQFNTNLLKHGVDITDGQALFAALTNRKIYNDVINERGGWDAANAAIVAGSGSLIASGMAESVALNKNLSKVTETGVGYGVEKGWGQLASIDVLNQPIIPGGKKNFTSEKNDSKFTRGTSTLPGTNGMENITLESLKIDAGKANEAFANNNALDDVVILYLSSTQRKESPEKFNQMVSNVLGNASLKTVYIDVDVLINSGLADKVSGLDPAIGNQIKNAQNTGGYIQLPLEKVFAGEWSQKELMLLTYSVKAKQDGFSYYEAAVYSHNLPYYYEHASKK